MRWEGEHDQRAEEAPVTCTWGKGHMVETNTVHRRGNGPVMQEESESRLLSFAWFHSLLFE